MRIAMAEAAERMKLLREIAAQVATLNPDSERDALFWIEAISEFDADAPR
jgi:hypothetical protein